MNEAVTAQPSTAACLTLREVALAAIAMIAIPADRPRDRTEETSRLAGVLERVLACGKPVCDVFDDVMRSASPEDAPLMRLREALGLTSVEMFVLALAAAAEIDAVTSRVLAHVQAPAGGSRPTLGLIARALSNTFDRGTNTIAALLDGPAFTTGALIIVDDRVPLCEQSVTLPPALCVAIAGGDGHWAGASIEMASDGRVALAPSTLRVARRHAAVLAASPRRALVVRTASRAEGRTVAAVIAQAINRRPVFLEAAQTSGLGPWIALRTLLPVFCVELSPGEVRRLPRIAGYDGPVLVLAGADGAIETFDGAAATWSIAVPDRNERRILWWAALGDERLAREMGDHYRHGAGRIAQLGRLAYHAAALDGRTGVDEQDVFEASSSAEAAGLDGLAQPVRTQVGDDALVVSASLRRELESVLLRCRLRDDLAAGLGASATTRYCPGLRVLMIGPSGTGKTLAAGWLATRLSLPLYRVDLASVTSKYVGETEKNLSQLLTRAEHAEVILLFDEADSLFGKRTDVSDANDRFANGQTNYLLQRIESYAGIVLLTSNGQTRFDPAFARRLDFTIEFPLPGPAERRSLWQSHLGPHARLAPADLNRLAALLDLSGGHIRNAVLAAAVQARYHDRAIAYADVVDAAALELAKLGRQMPVGLRANR